MVRGLDWRNIDALAMHDVRIEQANYNLNAFASEALVDQGRYSQAAALARLSIAEFPTPTGYVALGLATYKLGQYLPSANAYLLARRYGETQAIDEGASRSMVFLKQPKVLVGFVQAATAKYPGSAKLWEYLALLQYQMGDATSAHGSITQAYALSQSAEITQIYSSILGNQAVQLSR